MDPLAERVPQTFADLLYGEAPKITAANTADQDQLDELIEGNRLPAQINDAASLCAAEGEVWWRVHADRGNAEVPTIAFHSRRKVWPLMLAGRPVAVAFVQELPSVDESRARWRYVEVQTEGRTENRLYRSEESAVQNLGNAVPLTDHPQTADLDEGWDHGLSVMLAGRITNGPQRPAFGRSDYEGIKDLLLALNEATSIGAENARLTAKKRIVIDPSYLDESGAFPAGVDVLLRNKTDQNPEDASAGLAQLEWSFDAGALILWTEYLADTALTRARVAPQLVGRNTENAQTGPALRARLIDTVLAAQGKGRAWDDGLPQALLAAQLVDQLPEEKGGFGHSWSAAGEPPAVERKSVLPEDEDAQVQRLATEVGSELLSRKSAIRTRHPEWDDDQVKAELDQIVSEQPTVAEPFTAD